jgi:hypothetical protein
MKSPPQNPVKGNSNGWFTAPILATSTKAEVIT